MPQETVVSHPETFTHAESKIGVLESASQEQKIDLIEVTTLLLHGEKTIFEIYVGGCRADGSPGFCCY
jgi:hypothetical protein